MAEPEGERPQVERTSQQTKPEQTQPQQGRAEGKQSLQGPTTFDGHEPDAWHRHPAIFTSRTIEGMKALREEIERAQAHADRIGEINWEEAAKQLAATGKVDLLPFLRDTEIRTASYEEGLRDAFNLIVAHIQGKRERKEPESGLSQRNDVKQ